MDIDGHGVGRLVGGWGLVVYLEGRNSACYQERKVEWQGAGKAHEMGKDLRLNLTLSCPSHSETLICCRLPPPRHHYLSCCRNYCLSFLSCRSCSPLNCSAHLPPSLSHSFANLSLLLLLLTHHKCTCTPFLLNVVPSKYFLRVGYQTWPLGSKISFLL